MIEIKAPDDSQFQSFKKIFLAGSIEMGTQAEKWQERLAKDLKDEKVILFNPRRDDWDSSWVQDPTPGTQFHQQVNWEIDHIRRSDLVVFYFDPETQSPITLMELGYCIGTGKPIVICCPKEYFRCGNVTIMARLVGVTPVETYEEFVSKIRIKISGVDTKSYQETYVVDLSDGDVISIDETTIDTITISSLDVSEETIEIISDEGVDKD